ncbi:MAG: HIT family protein [Vicingaceae bacterium]
MSTIFKKIIDGEIPAHKIAENDQFLAFLDINPLAKGHTLVIPKIETDYIFEVEDKAYQALWVFAKQVAKKIETKITCKRIGIAVIGLEVAHAHIHLVPINNVEDINFARPKLDLSSDELDEIAATINA